MARYEHVKETIIEGRMFVKIQGIPLDGGPSKHWIPIRPCVCVTEPCPCDTLDDIIVWLPSNVSSERTGKQWDGNDVYSYRLDEDSRIMVEAQIPMTIGNLQSMKELAERGHGRTISVFQKKSKKKGKSTVGGLLVGAFELGWAIGEKIDEETGVSDKISDWLAENFPWPW